MVVEQPLSVANDIHGRCRLERQRQTPRVLDEIAEQSGHAEQGTQ